MESLYKELLNEVSKGKSFKIDFKNKTLKLNRNTLVDNGLVKENSVLINEDDLIHLGVNSLFNEPYNLIESLYKTYKHSVPTKANDGHNSYFKALNADKLTDEELVVNIQRSKAQAMLEGYIFFASLQGILKWGNEKHWFWQGTDRDLIVLKEWI